MKVIFPRSAASLVVRRVNLCVAAAFVTLLETPIDHDIRRRIRRRRISCIFATFYRHKRDVLEDISGQFDLALHEPGA